MLGLLGQGIGGTLIGHGHGEEEIGRCRRDCEP